MLSCGMPWTFREKETIQHEMVGGFTGLAERNLMPHDMRMSDALQKPGLTMRSLEISEYHKTFPIFSIIKTKSKLRSAKIHNCELDFSVCRFYPKFLLPMIHLDVEPLA